MSDDDDLTPLPAELLPDGESVILSARGSGSARRALLRPSSVGRATDEQHDALNGLQDVAVSIHELQVELRARVEYARDLGISWGVIGWYVGLTAEGARQKYGEVAPRPRSSKPSRRRR